MVNLGAGLCARPHRLNLKKCTRWEVDDPDLLSTQQIEGSCKQKYDLVQLAGDVCKVDQFRNWKRHSDRIIVGILEYLKPFDTKPAIFQMTKKRSACVNAAMTAISSRGSSSRSLNSRLECMKSMVVTEYLASSCSIGKSFGWAEKSGLANMNVRREEEFLKDRQLCFVIVDASSG
jgi:hypothetical protein